MWKATKRKGYWYKQGKNCDEDVKDKSSDIMVAEQYNTLLCVYNSKIGKKPEMLHLVGKRFASKQTETHNSVHTEMFFRCFVSKEKMHCFEDEFESLFVQLEHMGNKTKILETHREPLLLAIMGNYSPSKSTVASIWTLDTDKLSWEVVSAALIQEYSSMMSSENGSDNNGGRNSGCGAHRRRSLGGNSKKG